jgi:adenosylcobinamide-GDP ribazoletransferase
MKDSQIGTYGVLALLFVTGLRWLACAALLPVAPLVVIASAALSRAAMPAVMAALPHARATGLSQSVGRPTPAQAGLSVACGVIVAILLSGGWAFAMASIALIAAVCSGLIAQRKIGGQTGDILGATQQLADCGILIAMGAVLA